MRHHHFVWNGLITDRSVRVATARQLLDESAPDGWPTTRRDSDALTSRSGAAPISDSGVIRSSGVLVVDGSRR